MDRHTDLLAAWVLSACDDGESAAVEAHLSQCASCAAEARRLRAAAGWLGVDRPEQPPAELRHTVLARARELRRPKSLSDLVGAYAGQVSELDGLLGTLTSADWERADPRHDDVRGVVHHLAGNDGRLAVDLGLAREPAPAGPGDELRSAWRRQADALARGVGGVGGGGRLVRLAGRGEPQPGPLRDALVQRAFETWIHRDDIARVVGRPPSTPPPDQARRIAELAARLLPAALRANGVSAPGRAVRLALSGPGGGEWTVPLGVVVPAGPARTGAGRIVATVAIDAVDFCRLVANRCPVDALPHRVTGDRALAARVLTVAATLGCD